MSAAVLHTSPQLGEGIFLVRDAAEILRLPYRRVRRWMDEFWDVRFGAGHRYSFGERGNEAVNFPTLVEFYTFYRLREGGVSAQEIQKAHAVMTREMETPYPFAMAEGISADKRNKIWYKHLGALVKADGKAQTALEGCLKDFLRHIDFDTQTRLAARYYPLERSRAVVVDPEHQFGQPTLQGTNIRTATLWHLYQAGENAQSICALYGLKPAQVSAALEYHQLRAA